MSCPPAFSPILPLAEGCRARGGRALLVGGAVRDMLLHRYGVLEGGASGPGPAVLDLDVEVHGLPARALEAVLRRLGPVNLVGRAFSVWRTRIDGADVDVSLPRRDSRVGAGHRGIRAVGDPWLGIEEAARRRDLTVNAIAYDPLRDQIEDPFDGARDLRERRLRAVDPQTFGEDPLRALRVPQLAARLRFEVAPSLLALCATMPVRELPPERVHGELRKLLMMPLEPSWGLRVGQEAGLWERVHPALRFEDPEGTYAALDRAAAIRDARLQGQPGRAEASMLCSLLATVPRASLEPLLDRLDVHRVQGFPLRQAVLATLARAPSLAAPMGDGALRRCAREAQQLGGLRLWLAVAEALGNDCAGLARRAELLGVGLAAPEPLVKGRDLTALGVAPGPELGRLLERLYQRQLDEGIEDQRVLLTGLEA
jgi:tRNA nucleotidyltransferase (CCA-adding enzyme)